MKFKKHIFTMAQQDLKTIVFPEAGFSDKVIQVIRIVAQNKIAKVVLIGDESALYMRYNSLEGDYVKIINPKTSELRKEFLETLKNMPEYSGIPDGELETILNNPFIFTSLLVKNNYADGVVSGLETPSYKMFAPASEIIGFAEEGVSLTSTTIFIGKNKQLKNRSLLLSDCVANKNPTEKQLVDNANASVAFWRTIFIQEPKVAFLSHACKECEDEECADTVQKATNIFKFNNPSIVADGEMQLDTAVSQEAQERKFPNSRIRGDANVLIVPDATSGSVLTKSLAFIAGLNQIGSLVHGFKRPIGNASRTNTIMEIVMLTAITAIKAQE
jgi:phosphotransacetylase